MRRALWWGIDRYGDPNNNLHCCVNDVKAWQAYMESRGFAVETLLNSEATKYNILTGISNLAALAIKGDHIALGFSHHGTRKLDVSGDEADFYDEALFVYPGDVVLDDEMREALMKFATGVHVTVVADCCFGGTITRNPTGRAKLTPRFVETDFIPPHAKLRRRFLEEESMNHVLFAACKADQVSYEGSGHGVFTAVALKILTNEEGMTCNSFDTAVQEELPSSMYPQDAHVEGPAEERARIAFTADNGGPQPPEPEKPGCKNLFGILVGLGVCGILLVLRLLKVI